MSSVIRAMSIGDFDEVIALWKSVPGIGLNECDTREGIASYLVRNPGLSFVAESDGTIVGALLCGHDGRRGYLNHVAVAESHWRKGIANRMLHACFRKLRETGIARCSIHLFANNESGREFWTHNGWKERDDLCVLQKVT
jgi:N-acetylglutamate synthase